MVLCTTPNPPLRGFAAAKGPPGACDSRKFPNDIGYLNNHININVMKETTKTSNGHQIVGASGTDLKEALEAINPSKLMQSWNFLPNHFFSSLDEKLIQVNPTIEDGTLKLFHLKLSNKHATQGGKEMLGFYFSLEFEGEMYDLNAKCSLEQFERLNDMVKDNPSLTVQVKVSEGKESESGNKPIYFQFRPTQEFKKAASTKSIAKSSTNKKKINAEQETA